MAYRVVPTASFRAELDSVLAYLVEDLASPSAAKKLHKGILKARELLSESPEMKGVSTKVMLGEHDFRELLVRNYMVVYHFDGEAVYLEHLFHQSQDYERLL